MKLILFLIFCCLFLNNSLEAVSTVSTKCQNDVNLLIQLQYQNATFIIDSCGLKMGDMGNMAQCLDLPSNVSQYCIYQNTLALGTYLDTYYIGVCYPASCSEEDVLNLVPSYSLSPGGPSPLVHCYTSSNIETANRQITKPAIAIFVFSGVVIALVIIGTTIDHLYYHNNQKDHHRSKRASGLITNSMGGTYRASYEEASLLDSNSINDVDYQDKESRIFKAKPATWVKVLLGFSIIKNFKSFATVYPSGSNVIKENDNGADQNSSEKRIYFDSLDGIRTLSMAWVVLGHSLLFNLEVGYDNLQDLFLDYQGFAFQIIPAGEFAVDIFFMLSGFLVCHSVLKQILKKPDLVKSLKFWVLYIVHRFVRLSPLYYFIILTFVYVGPLLEYGPLVYLYKLDQIIPTCQNNLLPNFLYYNNLESSQSGECYPVSWYLANDFQFYIVAIIIFILYRYHKGVTWVLMSVLLIFSFTFSYVVSHHFKLQPFFSMNSNGIQGTNFNYTDIYERPWFRIGPYIVGMAFAFVFNEYTATLKKIYKIRFIRYSIYFLCLSVTTILTFVPYDYYQGNGWNLIQTSLWNALAHTAFPTAVGGFMLATFFGYGGVLKYFLELPVFKVLSKLTYSTYLVHQLVLLIRVMSSTELFHYTWIEYAYTFIGNLVCAMSVAFIVHLTIEKPFISIERLIFSNSNSN